MVESLNFQQALQVLARGDGWEAVVVDPEASPAVSTKTVFPGKKLKELITQCYPKLNPYVTSIATAKEQGSSIAWQDDSVVASMTIKPSTLSCRTAVFSTTARRPLPVLLTAPQPTGVLQLTTGDNGRTVGSIPSPGAYSRMIASHPLVPFPPVADYSRSTFTAYRYLVVYSDVATYDPRRVIITKLRGWIEGFTSGGSQVRVNLGNGR